MLVGIKDSNQNRTVPEYLHSAVTAVATARNIERTDHLS